jgi:hypothetical protein
MERGDVLFWRFPRAHLKEIFTSISDRDQTASDFSTLKILVAEDNRKVAGFIAWISPLVSGVGC